MAFESLLQIVGDVPGLRVLEATSHVDELSRALAEHVTSCGGQLHISAYPGEHAPVATSESVRYAEVGHYKAPFKATVRDFEVIILRDLLDRHLYAEKLLKHAYQGLENSALVIVIQREGSITRERVEAMLNACEYRAVNTISDLLPGCFVTVGKKLHMWGNGL